MQGVTDMEPGVFVIIIPQISVPVGCLDRFRRSVLGGDWDEGRADQVDHGEVRRDVHFFHC